MSRAAVGAGRGRRGLTGDGSGPGTWRRPIKRLACGDDVAGAGWDRRGRSGRVRRGRGGAIASITITDVILFCNFRNYFGRLGARPGAACAGGDEEYTRGACSRSRDTVRIDRSACPSPRRRDAWRAEMSGIRHSLRVRGFGREDRAAQGPKGKRHLFCPFTAPFLPPPPKVSVTFSAPEAHSGVTGRK